MRTTGQQDPVYFVLGSLVPDRTCLPCSSHRDLRGDQYTYQRISHLQSLRAHSVPLPGPLSPVLASPHPPGLWGVLPAAPRSPPASGYSHLGASCHGLPAICLSTPSNRQGKRVALLSCWALSVPTCESFLSPPLDDGLPPSGFCLSHYRNPAHSTVPVHSGCSGVCVKEAPCLMPFS